MRETRNLEFKQSVSKTFLKTVSAFANYGTGRILFGVDDAGKSIGLEKPINDALHIENMINDSLDPVPRYTVDVDESAKTICLTVFEGEAKPFFCARSAYRRADSSTVEVDRVELGRLFLAGQNRTFDELPSDQKNLSFSLLAERFVTHLGMTAFDDNSLRALGLIAPDGRYTNAGEILSDSNSLAGVDIVKFGRNVNEFLERKVVVGKSVLEQYDAALEMYDRYCTYEVMRGATRETVERVPFEAFRETVANALVHRTWDVDANVTISMSDDSVAVVSPGALPIGVSVDEYLGGGISIPRNPIVANAFFRLDYIERFGTGVTRINEAYKDSVEKPSFEVRSNSLAVTLPFISDTPVRLSKDESLVLSAMSRNLLLARSDIERVTGFSKDKTIRVLNRLMAYGLVTKEGSGRNRKYCMR